MEIGRFRQGKISEDEVDRLETIGSGERFKKLERDGMDGLLLLLNVLRLRSFALASNWDAFNSGEAELCCNEPPTPILIPARRRRRCS